MIAMALQFGVARLSGRKNGHPNRSATPIILGLTIIGDSSMKYIELTQGKQAIVDDEDFGRLSNYRWCVTVGRYASYAARSVGGRLFLMHRDVLGLPVRRGKKGAIVDHINSDGLDNRKANLRLCDFSQNTANGKVRKNNTSGYRGVVWNKTSKRWVAQTHADESPVYIGSYFCIIKAAKAYDDKAKELFGEFANLNFKGE